MKETQTVILPERPNFTIVRKDNKAETKPAKMVQLKKIEQKPQLLLPPPQENYIKPKKHDFF